MFDYVWTNHVIEHTEDPNAFCREVSRIGHQGYLGAPSELYEILFNSHPYHKWILNIVDGELMYSPKSEEFSRISTYFGKFFPSLQKYSSAFDNFYRGHFNLFKVNINWENEIKCVLKDSFPIQDYSDAADIESLIINYSPYQQKNHQPRN